MDDEEYGNEDIEPEQKFMNEYGATDRSGKESILDKYLSGNSERKGGWQIMPQKDRFLVAVNKLFYTGEWNTIFNLTEVDLEKILQHYGCTFDDVIVENVFTTNMQNFIKVSGYRNSIYKKQFPTGTWLEVKGLALVGQLIEIDMEVHKTK